MGADFKLTQTHLQCACIFSMCAREWQVDVVLNFFHNAAICTLSTIGDNAEKEEAFTWIQIRLVHEDFSHYIESLLIIRLMEVNANGRGYKYMHKLACVEWKWLYTYSYMYIHIHVVETTVLLHRIPWFEKINTSWLPLEKNAGLFGIVQNSLLQRLRKSWRYIYGQKIKHYGSNGGLYKHANLCD